GSSRTFMGEESAGVDAVRVAQARIEAGQSDIVLVGGAQNGERKELLLLHVIGGHALTGDFVPVWERTARGGGLATGSLGAFLVLEARPHAQARNARPLGRLSRVLSGRSVRDPGATSSSLSRMWQSLAPRLASDRVAVISGATGVEPVTGEERAWL